MDETKADGKANNVCVKGLFYRVGAKTDPQFCFNFAFQLIVLRVCALQNVRGIWHVKICQYIFIFPWKAKPQQNESKTEGPSASAYAYASASEYASNKNLKEKRREDTI